MDFLESTTMTIIIGLVAVVFFTFGVAIAPVLRSDLTFIIQ